MTAISRSLNPSFLEQLASTELLNKAYAWLCHAWKEAGHNHSIWDLRRRWPKTRAELQQRLLNQTFEFGPCRSVFHRGGGQCLSCWDAEDSVVQKALCLLLIPYLSSRISQRCVHLAGRGGCQEAVREVKGQCRNYSYVLRSNVKSYYSTMDHSVVLSLMRKHLSDPAMVRLLESFLTHVTDWRGEVEINTLGIVKGSPLSPLLGALYLAPLDEASERLVARCRDAKSHPRKTFIGQISKEFDFLGFYFSSPTLPPLEKVGFSLPLNIMDCKKHLNHRFRLYE